MRIARKADGPRMERRFAGLKATDRRCSVTVSGGINRPPMERTRGTVQLYRRAKAVAAETIHWGFGATAGAAYGVLAEYFPAATSKDGASFGLALEALTHEGALPAMGLSAAPEDQTAREHTSEMATHLLFGVVTETVRRFVRKML